MFIREKKRRDKSYLQIVENHRENGKVIQTVIATLGRLDILQESGQLDSLLKSGLRFSTKLQVLNAHDKGETTTTSTRKIGPSILFERIWRETGIKTILENLLKDRAFSFSVERVIFTAVLHRLFSPGSDRAALKWMSAYKIDGFDEPIDLHHFYRTMGWLGEPLPNEMQGGATPFVARSNKDLIEEGLFAFRKDLFTKLDIVFFDTTSLHFEGSGGAKLGRRGHSKNNRSDLAQVVVGVVLDDKGNPICSQIMPGNTTDVKTLIPIANRLKARFGVSRVCIVSDRGMTSETTIDEIVSMGWDYIFGVRMHVVNEVKNDVLCRGGRYMEIYPERLNSKDPSPLKVKEVLVDERRYIVCHNEEQSRKDQHDREAIVASLKEKLKQGDKSLVGNNGYRRYLKSAKGHFDIDEEKIADAERFDGKWVLRTNTKLSTDDVAMKYKQLWMVEDIFRTMKSVLDTRPIFHRCDDNISGHVFCSFLALLLRKTLQDRIIEKGWKIEWSDIVRDIDAVQDVAVTHGNKKFVIRTETTGVAGKTFQTVGAVLPPVLREA
jgi:hypothetical protein